MDFKQFHKQKIQDSFETPFDPTNDPDCEFVSETVQDVVEELCNRVAASASPGFTFGASGNTPTNTWLLCDTVPSNKTGRPIHLNSPTLESVFVANENTNTFDLEIYEHDGTTFTLVYTLSLTAQRSKSVTGLNVALTTGKELAIKVSSGSAKNVVAGLQLKGSV